MANILAIETSSIYCSIGLKKNEDFFFEHSKEENSHGKSILSFIDLILKKAGLKKNQIDFIEVEGKKLAIPRIPIKEKGKIQNINLRAAPELGEHNDSENQTWRKD